MADMKHGGETMFIETQNKDSIINLLSVNQISISSGYIMGKIEIKAYFSDRTYAYLGGYKNLERAKEVLKDIGSAYENSCYCNDGFDSAAQIQRPYLFMRNTVYQMPEE